MCPDCRGKVVLERDIGCDVWEGGEERQHIERCTNCGTWRMTANVQEWEDGQVTRSYSRGRWHKKDETLYE